MTDDNAGEGYAGPERRAGGPHVQIVQKDDGWLRKVEAIGPMVVVGAALAVAWGGFDVRMQVVEAALTRLQDLPLTLERLRADITAGATAEDARLRAKMAEMDNRLGRLEERLRRATTTGEWP